MHNKNRYEYDPSSPQNMRDFQEALEDIINLYERSNGALNVKYLSEAVNDAYRGPFFRINTSDFPLKDTPEEIETIN